MSNPTKEMLDQWNRYALRLEEATKIIRATQPFAKAWACEDLSDKIEEWLKEVKNERPPTNS